MQKIRVMIVEDSAAVRQLLEHLIAGDPRLQVAASVGSAEEALRIIQRVSPDVISMDIRLPGMNGFEATQRIMAQKPTPVVVVSASVEAEDLNIAMNALRAGALSVVEKPVGVTHRAYEAMAGRLCGQLTIMSQVKVIRQRFGPAPGCHGQRGGEAAESSVEVAPTRTDDSRPPRRTLAVRGAPQAPPAPAAPGAPGFGIVGIVASTGGPKALESVLGGLPADFPLPVVLVQHIDRGFVDGFTSWLDRVCALHVTRAQDGQTPRPGAVYVAPGDRHLRVQRRVLRLDDAEPVALQRPSGTLLLRSMADSFGGAGIGVLLTGMGEDGAEGLLAVRRAGGHTIAEDESTAVVYGMPAAAVRLGGVCESLPLGAIANRLSRLAAAGNEAQQQTLLSSSEPLRRQGDRQEVA